MEGDLIGVFALLVRLSLVMRIFMVIGGLRLVQLTEPAREKGLSGFNFPGVTSPCWRVDCS